MILELFNIPDTLKVKCWKAKEKDVYLFHLSLPKDMKCIFPKPDEIWKMIQLGIYEWYGLPVKAIE